VRTINSALALRNINIEIKHGEFICVIGDVGSGKSSLLSSIIGDLLYLNHNFLKNYRDHPIDEDIVEIVKKHS